MSAPQQFKALTIGEIRQREQNSSTFNRMSLMKSTENIPVSSEPRIADDKRVSEASKKKRSWVRNTVFGCFFEIGKNRSGSTDKSGPSIVHVDSMELPFIGVKLIDNAKKAQMPPNAHIRV